MPPKKAPAKKPAKPKAKKPVKSKAPAKPKAKRATPAAFKKKFKPDAALAAVVGTASETRGQFMKKIWDYIKAHNLQDPSDRRMIVADAKLRPLFGVAKLSMLKLGGIVSRHISE